MFAHIVLLFWLNNIAMTLFQIRCLAQPLHANGSPGIPLRSQPRVISHTNAICKSPSFGEEVQGYHAQSFLASLSYMPPDAARHANTIHIRFVISVYQKFNWF